MRHQINRLIFTFLMLFTLLACNREDPNITKPTVLEIDADDNVSSLRVMYFAIGSQNIKGNDLYTGLQATQISNELNVGEYNFFFIANEPTDNAIRNALDNIGSLSDLDQISFPASGFNANNDIPMVLYMPNVTVLPESEGFIIGKAAYTNLTIKLERLAVRFDILLKSKIDLSADFTGIEFFNLPDNVPLTGSYTGTHNTTRTFTLATDSSYFTDTIIPEYPWAKKISRIILPANEFSPANQSERQVGFKVLIGSDFSPQSTFGVDEANEDYRMPHNTNFIVNAIVKYPMEVQLDVQSWIGNNIDADMRNRALNVSKISTTLTAQENSRIFFWTDQSNVMIETTGYVGTSGNSSFNVNDVFYDLGGANASNLYYNSATGQGYFDLISQLLVESNYPCRIYLNAGGLKREIQVNIEALAEQIIIFDSQGGSYVNPIIAYPGTTVYIAEKSYREGYIFTGWNTDPNGFGTMYQIGDPLMMFNYGQTLYGIFIPDIPKRFSIIFDSMGGTYIPEMSSEVGSYVTITQIPEKIGYSFEGWNTEWDGSGTQYNYGALFRIEDYDITLYAMWSFE